ncbi:tetratricopeptide repeat protein [Ruegeria conchae]|uniref:Tfp pilus assembly protein PilF n=1 Tax=Ruegeria conchae TaxID=981384 RepID=A0A497ZWF8_9RHOB|nr:tetratricopeptide repeat protein [Ruegeria conchae]RLK07337.1 Tfp pilus assembly protein PilF [Ruegeria conchae]
MFRHLINPPLIALCTTIFLAGCESSEERAERFYQSALELLETGDPELALLELRNVLELDVSHTQGRILFAQTLAQQGQIGEALNQYLRVVEQEPERLDTRLIVTRMSLDQNRWEDALRHGRTARDLAANNADVRFLNAVLDYREGIEAEDIAALDAPLQVAQDRLVDSPDDRLARRLVIDHAVTTGNPDLALRRIETALTHLPDEYEFHLARLRILSDQQDMAAIGEALRELTGRFPDRRLARNMRLAWHMEQKDVAGGEAFLRQLANAPNTGVDDHLQVVNFLKRTQGEEAARSELNSLISAQPENKSYQATLAALNYEAGQTAAAIEMMHELLADAQATEETANLKINLARMLISGGDVPAAEALISEVLAEAPGHTEALKMHATWQIREDRPEEAILTLRTAQAGAPRDPNILILMGQAHERTGARELAGERYALAVEASGRALDESLRYAAFLLSDDRLDVAETVLADALGVTPGNVELLTAMAEIQLRQKNWIRVKRLIWRLRAQDDPSALTAADRIEAAVLVQQNRTEDAIRFLSDLSAAEPADLNALTNLIGTMVQNGKINTAVDVLENRLQDTPGDPVLRYLRAGIYEAEGQDDEAEAIYRVLLTEDPENLRAVRQMARMLTRQGREPELTALLNVASDANPDAVLPRALRAEQLQRQNDFDGAIAAYDALYTNNSDVEVFANNLASLISIHRDDAESLSRAFVVARRFQRSDVPAFRNTYGWIVFLRGELDEAIIHLEAAAQGLPDNPTVQYHLGEAYVAAGRGEDAQRVLNRAVALSAQHDFSQLQRTQELLQQLSVNR